MTRRRALLLLGIFVLLAAGYSGWRAWQVQRDLAAAENSADNFIAALDSDDAAKRSTALEDFRRHASDAREGTSGVWWGAFTHLPLLGDDARGIRALSTSLDQVAAGAQPLADALDGIDDVTGDGRINLELVASLQGPVSEAARSFKDARGEVDGLDSSGYAGSLQTRFDEYVERVDEAADNLTVAEMVLQVLPALAGSDAPQTYLFVFQNNAEIRATGGLPGSWTEVRVDDGAVEVVRQGAGSDFPTLKKPPIPLTAEERSVYGDAMGQYFRDAGFTPDFPRAAELFRAHYAERYSSVELDGVLALDPVSLSYVLEGTGPVDVGDVTLTPDNATEQLLSVPYQTMSPKKQDAFFRQVAASLFSAITGDLASPRALIEGMARAGREGRFLLASFDEAVADQLAEARVLGAQAGADGTTPHVDVAMNDATGSKMSYYLRYRVKVESVGCNRGQQELEGEVTLRQSIRPAEARELPRSVTGGGSFGTAAGEQTVLVRIYGPYGGEMSDLSIDGNRESDQSTQMINGRPVYVLAMSVKSVNETVIDWRMTTRSDEDGDGRVNVTPGVVPGSEDSAINSACDPR